MVSFDKAGKKLYVVNGADKSIDILDISNPTEIKKVGGAIDLKKNMDKAQTQCPCTGGITLQ